MKVWISMILGLALGAANLAGQLSPVVSANVEQGSIQTSYYAERPRLGLTLGLGSGGPDGAVRLVLGIFPQGDHKPGWNTISLEMGPRFTAAPGLSVGAQGAIGGFDMKHRAIQGCTLDVGCMSEVPVFEEGWGMVGGAMVTGSLEVSTRVSVTVGHRWSWIFRGANKGESLRGWSLGLEYRLRLANTAVNGT